MYLWYIKSQGFLLAGLWFVLFIIVEGLQIYGSFWLTFWTEDPRLRASPQNVSMQNVSNQNDSTSNLTASSGQTSAPSIFSIQLFYMGINWLILSFRAVFYIVHTIAFIGAQLRSARAIHGTILGTQRMVFVLFCLDIAFQSLDSYFL